MQLNLLGPAKEAGRSTMFGLLHAFHQHACPPSVASRCSSSAN
jgi:hypothetical protein